MSEIIQKSKAFYDDFERKGSNDTKTTHYCPGCGHGVIHKYIADAIEELNCQDRTVLISPVGCSVFAYYYFDVGNMQVPHGRAPACATGVKRARPNSIVISYQGDGDLAAIGTAEIIHAANRGEGLTVFFVNNAIYGMTGGQMAPTTLLGQKTATSPHGRKIENEGFPIKMCELISTLEAPVYVERVSIADVPNRTKAKQVIKKALKNQVEAKGFSFVEILAGCPSGLKISPVESNTWVKDNMHKIFPIKCFKDETNTAKPYTHSENKLDDASLFKALGLEKDNIEFKPSIDLKSFKDQNVRIAGFGGQGILSAGTTLSVLGMLEGLETTWIPSYGPEMRGGTSNCHVRLSKNKIGSPLVEKPNVLIAMNGPSLETFENIVEKNGIIIVNSSIINQKVNRADVKTYYIPLSDIATNMGVAAAQTVAGLAAYICITKIMPLEKLELVFKKSLKRKDLAEKNILISRKIKEFVDTL